jgi:hypothetical protein
MTIIAFAGPSLAAADRAAHPDVDWRPPAEAGDLLRLRAAEGDVVCLIDGYFDHLPSIRHKEILLLLSRGISILGASSIGALRAAEMHSLGMIGVGPIYRAFASGRLCGDDEVALVHAPEDWDWKALSLPLVDCRADLHRAVRSRFVEPGEAREALNAAKSIHYADRDWQRLLGETSLSAMRQKAILDWVEALGISQKRLDALACVDAAKKRKFRKQPAPSMVRTSLLDALARECGLTPEELS